MRIISWEMTISVWQGRMNNLNFLISFSILTILILVLLTGIGCLWPRCQP
jgi:thiosulfate reductase cytochrome b subunit